MITLSIDPGTKHLGVALFDGDALIHAALVNVDKSNKKPMFPDALPQPVAYIRELSEIFFTHGYPERVIIELPQIYARSKSKGDPNDLIAVALVVGRLLMRYPHAELVKPRAWKGTVDKQVMLKRIEGRLSKEEKALIPKLAKTLRHNVIDGIGLGLWSIGRLGKKR